jgi:hypothetical protein
MNCFTGSMDGAVFDEASLHAYRQAQLDRVQNASERYPPAPPHILLDLDKGRSPRAQLIVRLASEDLDEADRSADHRSSRNEPSVEGCIRSGIAVLMPRLRR